MSIITIDGNIGCGKSTVMQYLHSKYGVPIDLEPVAKWQPYLTDMYESNKNAFEFQVRVWLDRCWIQHRPNQSPIVMERSPYFQSYVFVPAMYHNETITVREYHTLQEMYWNTFYVWQPVIYIYLRSNPVKCHERIQTRNRTSENAIALSYLEQLHKLHEKAYVNSYMSGMSVICIDVEGKTVEQIGDEVYNIFQMTFT